jgi:hypothetical protein
MNKSGWFVVAISVVLLAGCKTTPPVNGRAVPEANLDVGQLVESDPNRMANLEVRDNLKTLFVLMDELYARNPLEWKRGIATSRENAEAQVRKAVDDHTPLPGLNARDTSAIRLGLDPDFKGDRIATLIYGVGDMLITAHGGKKTLYLIDGLDAQRVYNASRNIEIIMWTLADRKDAAGHPLLYADVGRDNNKNISVEQAFGTMIGRTDLVAEFIAEKYRRAVIDYAQSFIGGQFLQFLPVGVLSSSH